MDQLVVKLDLLLGQLMVVCVDLVYELAIEIYQFLEFLLQQASHALFFALLQLFITLALHSASKVRVDGIIWVDFQDAVRLLSADTAVLASANLADVWTSP